jgi:hypothetical protein
MIRRLSILQLPVRPQIQTPLEEAYQDQTRPAILEAAKRSRLLQQGYRRQVWSQNRKGRWKEGA